MPLQIRRGTTAQRLTITPLPGELIYDTTTGQIFVGDGTTVGGAITTGVSLEDARDAAASLLTSGVHSGITFTYNDAADRIDATVTIGGIGPFDGDINGSVFADDSTLLVDAVSAELRGKLNVTGVSHTVTATAGNITLSPSGSVVSTGELSVTLPNGVVPSANGLISETVYFNGVTGPNFNLRHSRGTQQSPSTLQVGDSLGTINFSGYNGTFFTPGFTMSSNIENVISGSIGANLKLSTYDGFNIFEFTSSGTFKANTIQPYSGNLLTVNSNLQLTAQGDLRFSDSDSSNYVAFQAPATITSNVLWTLPATDGTNQQMLITNGSGTLSWASVASLLPGSITADVKGSVFASDSTMLVDATNGSIPYSVISGKPTNVSAFSNDAGYLTAIPGSITADVKGTVFADDSSVMVNAIDNTMAANSFTASKFFQLPIYADDAARLSAIPTPAQGMMIFMQSGTVPAATNVAQVFDGTNWINL